MADQEEFEDQGLTEFGNGAFGDDEDWDDVPGEGGEGEPARAPIALGEGDHPIGDGEPASEGEGEGAGYQPKWGEFTSLIDENERRRIYRLAQAPRKRGKPSPSKEMQSQGIKPLL